MAARRVAGMCAVFSVQLIGISHFRDAAHGYLSGEPEAFPQLGIARLVQVVLPEYLCLKCPPREPTVVLVATARRSAQSVFLLWRWLQTKVATSFIFQVWMICAMLSSKNTRPADGLLSSRLKAWVSRRV